MKYDIMVAAFGTVLFVLLFSFLLSFPVYFLWNECLVDAVQGVQKITWLQAWGLQCLFNILVKSYINTDK